MLARWTSKLPTKLKSTCRLSGSSALRTPLCALAARNSPRSPWQSRNHSTDAGLSSAWSSSHLPTHEGRTPGLVQSDAQRRTIYALSTPPGKAGVAVVRVSGPDALNVWHSIVSTRPKRKSKEDVTGRTWTTSVPEPWRMYRCEVVHPQSREVLDSGLAVYFKGML